VTAHGELRVREGWRLELCAGGEVGRGEALPLPSFGTESLEACERALRAAVERLGELPESAAQLESALEGLESAPAARFALETALLELEAKRTGEPLHAVLGEVQQLALPVNALLSGATPEALAESARTARAQGFGTVKVKVAGRPLAEDLARLTAVREAVGSKVQLRIDANGGWSLDEALRALEAFSKLGVALCEQPVAAADLNGLASVQAAGVCPIAADEALLVPGVAERLTRAAACAVLVLKPMALGGLRRTVALGQAAAAAGLGCVVTSLIDGEIARAAAAHVAAVLPGGWAHGLATGSLLDVPCKTGWLTPSAGVLHVPELPGLGVEVSA
jgi:o-succinylbenzoate synthase